MDDITIHFLTKVGIDYTLIGSGATQELDRNQFLQSEIYNEVASMIPELKKRYSSSNMTSLHKNASDNQKWPLLNITRQILKSRGYCMQPSRKSNGYNVSGKKRYKRSFIVCKIPQQNPLNEN